MVVKIKLKHEKAKHEVDVDVSAGIDVLRAQIYSQTGVPPDRQKIVIKGKELKDEDDLASKITPNLVAMLMGSAEAVPEKPKETTKFIEDEAGGHVIDIRPPGLKNLDNTCYLNASVQCFKVIPELKAMLAKVTAPPTPSEEGVLSLLKLLYTEMDKNRTGEPVTPMMFVMMCRAFWPQFDQQIQGHYAQQDAEEYCSSLMQAFASMKDDEGVDAATKLFQGEYEEVMTCKEAEAEPATTAYSTFRIMRCTLDADTATVEAGLERAMIQEREKNSPSLGRNAIYSVTAKLHKLPSYLWINLVRFEWRKDIGKKTKKLRKIVFPFRLDAFTLCSDGLKERMKATRETLKQERDRLLEEKRKDKQEKRNQAKGEEPKKEEVKEEEKKEEEKKEEEKGGDTEMKEAEATTEEYGNNSAYYELCGIVTHRGRDADSGHYIGWTLQDDGKWMCFDDHKVIPVSEDKIKELAGGGESDSAYLLLYRSKTASGKSAGLW
eukprot:TRINITY_DN3024_c3_g2_i1.p1 TRINITY_DN3024_c3_g2~~TRINITY_DN3024_c3_g2_i1.p1  ORF type:complete len:501 (+),score=256.36 TRINITY_DN3024_c3_g2_i1:30-1505(+)